MAGLTYAGLLLRRGRQERNWSQEGLCKGICTVSYLSKIEQGKTAVSDDILKALLGRLELPWYTEAEDLEQGRALAEEGFEALFAGDWDALTALLKTAPQRLRQGPFAPDLLLLEAASIRMPADEALEPCLDGRRLAVFRLLQGRVEEAISLYPCGLVYMWAGDRMYAAGDSTRALELLLLGSQAAAEAGQARIMLNCRILMGNCYSNKKDLPAMLNHYRVARRLAKDLGKNNLIRNMDYNIAATELELGMFAESYRFFSTLRDPDRMDLHKLAICCEKLGKTEEAREALAKARRIPAQAVQWELSLALCELISYRLDHPDYLKDEAYGTMLTHCFRRCREELPYGYASFHLPWMLEWYTATRQYRLAYQLLREFSGILP